MKSLENRAPEGSQQQGGEQKLVSSCPLCGTEYAPEEAKVVSEKEGAFLVHTNCKRCGSSVVATLIASQMGISSVGLITDLTYEDVVKFKDHDAITTDDILAVYHLLQETEDLEELFQVNK